MDHSGGLKVTVSVPGDLDTGAWERLWSLWSKLKLGYASAAGECQGMKRINIRHLWTKYTPCKSHDWCSDITFRKTKFLNCPRWCWRLCSTISFAKRFEHYIVLMPSESVCKPTCSRGQMLLWVCVLFSPSNWICPWLDAFLDTIINERQGVGYDRCWRCSSVGRALS